MAQILVVDESSTVRNEVGDFLQKNGFTVAFAVDGKDGLVKLKADPAVKLVVCDVNMPNMDGITFLKELKTKSEHKFTPVIMLTTENQDAKKKEGQAAGAKAWIVKPFQPPQLLAAVEKLIM